MLRMRIYYLLFNFRDVVRLPVFELTEFLIFRYPVGTPIFERLVDAPVFGEVASHPWHSAWGGAADVALPL